MGGILPTPHQSESIKTVTGVPKTFRAPACPDTKPFCWLLPKVKSREH